MNHSMVINPYGSWQYSFVVLLTTFPPHPLHQGLCSVASSGGISFSSRGKFPASAFKEENLRSALLFRNLPSLDCPWSGVAAVAVSKLVFLAPRQPGMSGGAR